MLTLHDLPTETLDTIVATICRDRNSDLSALTCTDRSPCDCPPVPPPGQNLPPCHRRRRTALWSLCLTSRRLYAVAVPHLYHHLEQPYHFYWSLLARTLAERPDLGRHTRSLRWNGDYVDPVPSDLWTDFWHETALVDFFSNRRDEYLVTCPDEQYCRGPGEVREAANSEVTFSTLLGGDESLVLALITSMLPNLEMLVAKHSNDNIGFRFSKPGSLPRLRYLHLQGRKYLDIPAAKRVFIAARDTLDTVVLEMCPLLSDEELEHIRSRENQEESEDNDSEEPEEEGGEEQGEGEGEVEEANQELQDFLATHRVDNAGYHIIIPRVTHLTITDCALDIIDLWKIFITFPNVAHFHFKLAGPQPSSFDWNCYETAVREHEQAPPWELVAFFRSRNPKCAPRLQSFILEIMGNYKD
ncbi:hypothetical protein VTJ49DRAFT_3858 [Mycothermus thermophilus]|uniref:F-box domain-containing protein n=1 Tax=Humicola insolens TaxID=85995 RepID=A0ABR3VR82_HUMIN